MTLGALLYTGGAALSGRALVDRGEARVLGWSVAAAAPVCLVLVLSGIWSFVFEGDNEPASKLAWSAVLALLAGLLSTTARLLARRRPLVRLAVAAGALAALASALSIIGIWVEPEGDGYVKVLAAVWILAALTYFLVPVLERFTSAGEEHGAVRVLASLDDVELVAIRADEVALDVRVEPGEHPQLRRRPSV